MYDLKSQILDFVNSSDLFDDSFYSLKAFNLRDLSIGEIKTYNINENLPFGKRVEKLFEFYINSSSNYKIIKQNIQIINNKNTLGEIDFIIENSRKELFHVELVCKFYLYDINFEKEINRYIGINKDDTLTLKLDKLKNRQLPLLFKDETKAYLKDLDLKNIKQRVLFKAQIFLPYVLKSKGIKTINDFCIVGYYINYSKFIESEYFKDSEYYFFEKKEWLRKVSFCLEFISLKQILKKCEVHIKKRKAFMLCIKKDKKLEKVFITF